MKAKEIIKKETMNWVNRVVIGLNFCPFAAPVVTHDKLHFRVVTESEWVSVLMEVVGECNFLDASEKYETSLVVMPNLDISFLEYLDLVQLAEELLERQGYLGVFQLATFHPDYLFAEAAIDDPANFTNRSPYPMFHIIPEESLEKAIESYPNVEEIPVNNKKLARHKGLAAMESLRKNCFVEKK